MISKDEAFNKISELVERFSEQFVSYKRAEYNETLTRRDFIDPFFKALGWDIDNSNGYAEAYREVIHEDKVKVSGATKAPDYSFRLSGGKRLFFVEAKKPSIFIKDDIIPAYQIRRYGWSAKLPISIVTDFEEFAVYDCTKKPNVSDKASVARIKYLTYNDYIAQFDFLWDTFSKEKVLKGSFDKYIQSDINKKGTATVDKAFLQSLDNWRTLTAIDICKRNVELDEDELNFAVQQLIDRLIFLRIAEDRSVEPYGQLKDCIKQGDFYKNLFHLFKQADEKYNSGLFDLRKDQISSKLSVDSKVIKTIINDLYYPESPYEFSVLSVEILGSAYEQFLGKQIKIDSGHKARIEEKPEVRKAGGVYYTPQYIVEYIVKNTVGQVLNGKTPKEVSKIKILDPACGSGSFLIGAFQYLINWHKDYYSQVIKKSNPITQDGNLTTAEKKRILLNNIYGVDIDTNAVEVTKLSLLLKCMEGETSASIAHQLTFFNERVLPTLENNIKDGNSLVNTDYYEYQLDFGHERKVKPFNWQKEFPFVYEQEGFDVVIGNPPYVFGRDWKSLGIGDEMKSYLGSHYLSSPYQLDFFSIFMEKGVQLVKESGFSSFIVPNVWLTNTFSSSTRKFLLSHSTQLHIIVPRDKVFEGITVDTVIYISQKGQMNKKPIKVSSLGHLDDSLLAELDVNEYSSGLKPISPSLSEEVSLLIKKIAHDKISLGQIADITRGVHPYRLGGYGKSAFTNGSQIQKDIDERPYHSKTKLMGYVPFAYGKDLKLFKKLAYNEYIKYGSWLAEPRNEKFFHGERIFSRKILGKTLIVTVENDNVVADQQVYITKPNQTDISAYYLAGILGSKLISFFIRHYFDEVDDAFPQIKVGQLKSLPIALNNDIHNKLKELVQNLIALNDQKDSIKLQTALSQLNNKLDHFDTKINSIVYKLYNLTPTEIKTIEGG